MLDFFGARCRPLQLLLIRSKILSALSRLVMFTSEKTAQGLGTARPALHDKESLTATRGVTSRPRSSL
jgi:hypothetical protein